VMDQSSLWPLLLDCHPQRARGEFDLHMVPHGPADDLSAEEIMTAARYSQPSAVGM
jgi:hypothetical protein